MNSSYPPETKNQLCYPYAAAAAAAVVVVVAADAVVSLTLVAILTFDPTGIKYIADQFKSKLNYFETSMAGILMIFS